jgi:NAD(P)-dependent dehydrogenase (short-subunit alcohol dehydrogenase family)
MHAPTSAARQIPHRPGRCDNQHGCLWRARFRISEKAGVNNKRRENALTLEGKVALVSGTGPNIGAEIARTLAGSGASVACMDLNEDFARQAAQSITDAGGKAIGVAADITQPDQVQSAVSAVLSEFGAIHVLVNDAAISDRKPFLEADLSEWQRVLDVILTGTFIVSQAVARRMVEQGQGGAIVNIVSTSGHAGETGRIAYGTAKSGLLNFTRSLALQLAPHGIRVNSVTPSTTGTRVGDPGGRARQEGPPPSTKTVPLGRWGRPRDQAEAVLFLASPAADFITGVNIPVDGGNLAGRAGGGG